MNNSPRSVYIHVPFCRSRCTYCDFFTAVCPPETWHTWHEGLLREIDLTEKLRSKEKLTTVYFGGGTPSLVDAGMIASIIERLKERFGFEREIEITLEANPESVTKEKALIWQKAGINRVSLGLQSVDEQMLKLLGRPHTVETFKEAVAILRHVGIFNLSADLMFGLPTETFSMADKALDLLAEFDIPHVSFYALSLEPGTPLFNQFKDKEMSDEEEKLERAIYWQIRERLERQGLIVYEISNAGKPDYFSKHNLVYWRQKSYFGFGPAAASFAFSVRRSNAANIDQWLEDIEGARNDGSYTPSSLEEVIDEEEAMKETMLLGLRLTEGIDIGSFHQRFGRSPRDVFSAKIKGLEADGLLEEVAGRIRLTKHGIDFANLAFAAFI